MDDINDLTEDTDADENVVWYRDVAQTDLIPTNELLEDGHEYFAGNAEGDCTNPPSVTVTVETLDAPVSGYGSVYSPYLESETAIRTISDLTAAIDSTQQDNQIVVYVEEFGTVAYNNSDPLSAGETYFVGQTSTSDCYSLRIAIRYSPDIAPAPDAVSPQEFCEGATVADLEATGTSVDTQAFRWYSTATSNPALEEDEELISGTYYVSQIVNDEGFPSPPVESEARTEVTVVVTPLSFIEETQRFCESIGEGNDFRQPEVQDLSPAGEWFADATSTEPLDLNTELVDGEDYFNRDTEDECSQLRVTAEFFPTPNAGSTTQVSFCENEVPVNLVDFIEESQLGAPDQTGTFNPALENNIFDPSDYEPGVYNFTYIVEGNEDCPTDTSAIQVTVQEAPNAGDDVDESVCSSELENPTALIAEFSSYLEGRDQTGTFDDLSTVEVEKYTIEDVAQTILLSEASVSFSTYSFAYNVENDAGCEASANIELTVLESPDAGENGSIEFTREDDPVNLFDYLGGTPDENGVWSPGNQNGDFDPATGNAGTYTYTVSSTNGCEDSATVSVSFENEPIECPVVTESEQAFCESIGEGNNSKKPTVSDLLPTNAVWYATADGGTPLADDTILEDGETYFAGNINGTCEDRDSVTVTLDDSPNAGATTTLNICDNAEAFDILDELNESILGQADAGGTITPALASGTTIFDPAVDASGTYTYTVSSTNEVCPDDKAIIYINFLESPDAGMDINETFCVADISEIVDDPQDFLDLYSDDNRTPGGTFTPSLEELATRFSSNPYDTFSTVYSVTVNGCTDTANLSVTIDQEVPANAGDDVVITFCSTDGPQDLEEFLSEDAIRGGSFEGLEGSIFDPSTADLDEPTTIIYTVNGDNACVTGVDTATFTITVLEGPYAGDDASVEFTREDDPVNLFDYLGGTPDEGGLWSPGNENGDFDPATGKAGDYTYTVISDNECEDSATLSVSFTDEPIVECPVVTESEQAFCESIGEGNDSRRPRVYDLIPANVTWYATADSDTPLADDAILENGETYFAGNINATCEDRDSVTVTLDDSPNAGATTTYQVCRNAEPFDIVNVMNESILGAAETGGTISPALESGTTIFDPAVDAARQYTYTVSSTNEVCPDDEARITISFIESDYAGEDMDIEVCSNAGPQNLYDFISAEASTTGEFLFNDEVIEDGIMEPSEFAIGGYEITYFVESDDECGDDSATLTVTVNEVPDAPAAPELDAFCAIEMATGADLPMAEGQTWYADADLTTMVAAEDVLEDGAYYLTVTSENGCESEATEVTVSVNDSPAPTISSTNLEFCDADNPTIAELTAEIVESGDITWYDSEDGTNALGTSTTLTSGTYYATLTGETGCESSQRLAVTVSVENCPILYPEAITPNGDGRNDTFIIENITNEYPNYSIEIFNRWGNVIYKGNASTPAWDGTSNQSGSFGDDVLPVGVYFYVIDFSDGSTEPKQGKVYLSR
ncbi:MAG: gliding motility-associated C-terminal domain-containing protein [Bacteroidota bacterium]